MTHRQALSPKLWPGTGDRPNCDGDLTTIGGWRLEIWDMQGPVARCDKCGDLLEVFPSGAVTITTPDIAAQFEVPR